MSDPSSAYHLEIATSKGIRCRRWWPRSEFDLTAGIVTRKRRHLLYLKEGERIADFLRLVGANQALLHMERCARSERREKHDQPLGELRRRT